jgi:hypothetical protein
MEQFETGRCPPPHELVGVDLRAAGIRIIEVPPCEDVHAADSVADEFRRQLVDAAGWRWDSWRHGRGS